MTSNQSTNSNQEGVFAYGSFNLKFDIEFDIVVEYQMPHIPSFTEKKFSCEKQMVTELPGPNKMKVDKALDELVGKQFARH